MSPVSFDRRGPLGIAILDRPKALNAINGDMIKALLEQMRAWQTDPDIRNIVLRSSSDRAFCAGGDIKAVHEARGDAAFMDYIYRIEYELDYLIHSSAKPVVALINGITMGGGCGLSLHAAHKVASEDLDLAMPETGIGFFPDVGASVFLGRLESGIGNYLGLTGARIGAGDALNLGLIDAVVPRARHDQLVDDIASGVPVETAIAAHQVEDHRALRRVLPMKDLPLDVLSRSNALSIVTDLEARDDALSRMIAALLRQRCPFSLAITARLIATDTPRSVRDALATDFRVALRFMHRGDYFEGVRAVLIDRDNAPKWHPDRLEAVDRDEVDSYFEGLESAELWPRAEAGM